MQKEKKKKISVWKKSSRGCNADNMLREETPEQFIIKHSLVQTHDQIRTMREIPNPEQLRDGQSRCLWATSYDILGKWVFYD